MKKIVLAPAVALAFTGLVASPVAAAESPSTQSSDSAEAKAKKAEAEKAEKEKAEAEKKAEEKAAAEKEAAEKAAKEKAEKEKAEAEKKAADKAAKEKAAKEKAEAEDKAAEDKGSDEKKDEKAKTPKKVDPKPAPSPKDGDEGDEVEELNASLKLSTQSIKAEDLAEEGLKVTVTGLEKGDKVSVSGGDLTAGTTTASGSSATLTLNTNEDAEDIATKQSVSLQVERAGVAPQSLTDTVSVQSSEDDSIDASLTVDPEEITSEDLADKDKGVEVTVSGVEKGDKVTDSLTDNEKSVASDGDFTFGVYYKGNAEDLEEGPVPFEVTIDREGTESETLKGTIDVVDDTEVDPSVKLESKKITLEDFKKDGLEFTGSGFSPDGTVSVQGEAVSTQRAAAPQADELRADEDGNVEGAVVAPESLEAGKYALTFIDDETGEKTDAVEVTVTEDEDAVDPIDASLTVDPEEITAEDLADKDKGVEVTVSGVEKGDKVTDSLTDNEKSVASDGDFTFGVYYKGNAEDLEEGPVPFEVTIDREGTESETLKGTIDVVDDTEVDPSVKLESKKITLEDFKKDGLEFTGSGFSPDGTVSVQGEAVSTQRAAAPQADELRADEDGNVEGAVVAPESLEAGKYALTFIDDETGEKTDAVEVTVTEDEDAVDPIDASLTVDPEEITAEDLADKDKGVEVTVSGVKKGDRIKDSLTGKTETAEADGDHVLHLWWDGNPDSLEVGKVPFSVTIDREGTESETLKGNINVVGEDDGDDGETDAPAEAAFKVSPKTIEAADFANEDKGVTLAVENCEPGQDVHFEVNPKGINVTAYENTVKADDEGRASVNVFGTSSDASAYVGSYTATATCGDDTMKDSFKVTEGADSGGDSGNGGDNGNAGNGDGSQLPRTGADLGGLTTGALLLLVGGAAIAITGRKNKFGQNPTSF